MARLARYLCGALRAAEPASTTLRAFATGTQANVNGVPVEIFNEQGTKRVVVTKDVSSTV